MKTKNLLQAFGTANLSLLAVGLLMHIATYAPSSDLVSKVSNATFADMDMIMYSAVVGIFKLFCAFGIAFGAFNGVLSFIIHFDWKNSE